MLNSAFLRNLGLVVALGVGVSGCGGADEPQPTAGPMTIGEESDRVPGESATDTSAEDEQPGADDAESDSAAGNPASQDPTPEDPASQDPASEDPASQAPVSEAPDEPPETLASTIDLDALLPPTDAIASASATGYSSLDELIAERSARPPLLRCGADQDPTSLAIGRRADAAGRTYDYDDGVSTVTLQIWDYPDEAAAAQALQFIRDLRCDSEPVGTLNIDDRTYEQTDTATDASSLGTSMDVNAATNEIVGARFERLLDDGDQPLIVQENLQVGRLGTVVILAGAREIRSVDAEPNLPEEDWLRLGQQTISAAALALGRSPASADQITSPLAATVGDEAPAGTYRSTATSFCLVRIDAPDDSTAQVRWAAGEQAVVTLVEDTTINIGEGCGVWTAVDPSGTTSPIAIPGSPGTLVVGADLPRGPLMVTSVGECIIDQLVGFTGAPTDLISSTILAPGESIELQVGDQVGVYLASDCRY